MRSTKVKVLAVTAAVTVMFTGCMTENANVKINSDGTASAVATVDIDKASMDTWLTSAGMTTSDISDGKQKMARNFTKQQKLIHQQLIRLVK